MGLIVTPPVVNPPVQLLTVKQLAAATNMSTSWIYKHSVPDCADPIPYLGFGKAKRFDLEAVRVHLQSRQPDQNSGTLSGTDGIARVNGKALRRMTRRRYQTGHVRLREDRKQPWWEGSYWQDLVQEDGRITRKRKTVKIGLLSDLETKRAAQRVFSEVLSEINDANYRPKSAVSFKTFVNKYREKRLVNLADNTQHGYENSIKHYLSYFGDILLADMDTELIQAFINKKKSEGLAYYTLHHLKFDLSAIFSRAIKWGYLKENPVRHVELPPKGIEEQVKLPDADHLALLMDALEEPYRTLVWFHAVTIVRPNEGFAFKCSDLNAETGELTLVRAVNRGKFHVPKYHRMNRPIKLAPADVERLLAYKEKMGLTDADWMFPSKNRKAPLRYEDVLQRKIQPVAKKLGLPHVTWRILRKWGSTDMIKNRVPVNAVQHRLGHTRPDIVLRHYAQLLDESAMEAALLLSNKVSEAEKKLAKLKQTQSIQ